MKLRALVWLWIGLCMTAARAGGLPPADDLAAAAAQAQKRGAPLVVMFETGECPYCKVVRDTYLAPLVEDPHERRRFAVRVVNLDDAAPLVDFRGRRSSHAQFAQAQGIDFVPTLRFFDASGAVLVPDMVGLMLEDFYAAYLAAAIDAAQTELARRSD